MKSLRNTLVLLLSITILIFSLDYGQNIILKKNYGLENSINLIVNNTDEFDEYIDSFSVENNIQISKYLHKDKLTEIYTTNDNFIISKKKTILDSNKTNIYPIENVRNIGYNGIYFFNTDNNIISEKFCQGISKKEIGTCTILTSQDKDSLMSDFSGLLITICLIMCTTLLLVVQSLTRLKKDISILKVSGISNLQILKFLLLQEFSFLYNHQIIFLFIFLINKILIRGDFNVPYPLMIFILFQIIIYILYITIIYIYITQCGMKNLKGYDNRKERILLEILKFFMILISVVIVTNLTHDINNLYYELNSYSILKKYENLYTFDISYTGELDEEAYKKNASRNGEFTKSIINNENIIFVEQFYDSTCSELTLNCNGMIVNNTYIDNYTEVTSLESNKINILIPKSLEQDVDKDYIESELLFYADNDTEIIFNTYVDDDFITFDSTNLYANNPIIIVDYGMLKNEYYSAAISNQSILYKTDSMNPYDEFSKLFTDPEIKNSITSVYNPLEKQLEYINNIQSDIYVSFTILSMNIISTGLLILFSTKQYFNINKKKIVLEMLYGRKKSIFNTKFIFFKVLLYMPIIMLCSILHLNLVIIILIFIVDIVIFYVHLKVKIKNNFSEIIRGE